ncbi:hypothetical protein FZEAL_126 [Fusarium zealandicum]|uniref:DUF7514 domain-containing protein n=1 Tax=Fusarium zealandicum TaxID=1053134 RepID=A0A8H4UVU5_9HYPO|nr:hypothetical protein FZEAL_126 [Fusarium zealandicum]
MAAPPKTDDTPPGVSSTPPPPPIEYTYMYEKDKSPSKQLDALLRAISRHILHEIGDNTITNLTPDKLAAFYKAVGGDYDSLFEMPHASISYIWQVTGCQHTLQPTDDDFAPPSIPALTPRGFSRWESLEILLGPEEHVPFLQYAVKNWHLQHPETGQEFPADLPKNVFPAQPDFDVDRWHKSCADKLRKEANARERETVRESPGAGSEAGDTPEPKFAYSHVRGNAFSGNRARPAESAYERPLYNHVPGRHAGARPARPSPERYNSSRFDEHARRRSFSDYNTPPPHADPPPYSHGGTYLDPNAKRPPPPRRHSQPRHYSSDSTDDDEEPTPPRPKRRPDPSPPSPTSRRYSPTAGQPSPAADNPPSFRPHRANVRPDDPARRRPAPSPSLREKLTEKVSNMLPNGSRNSPRTNNSYSTESARARRSRDRIPPSRLSRSYSDLTEDTSEGGSGDDEAHKSRRSRDDRERDRDRERLRERERGRQRDIEREREREDERRERYLRRPDMERRTSSHADAERRRDHPGWDPRNERKRRDVRMPPDERGDSPAGASGRRYPEPAYS